MQANVGTVEVAPWEDGTGVTLVLPNVAAQIALGPRDTRIQATDSRTRRQLQGLVTRQLGSL